ncbi:hypothetical protein PS6_004228 [Mucor atramentarius]
MDTDIYNDFTSKLTVYLKRIFTDKSICIDHLNDTIDFGFHKFNHVCFMPLSHRTILDIRVAPYLEYITSSVLDATEDKDIFGQYQVDIMTIIGNVLYQWVYAAHPMYSFLAWTQLEAT